MRRAAKVDRNHAEVRDALRAVGVTVHDTSGAHAGFPDLVCEYRGLVKGLEVKDGTLPPSARKLTDAEAKFHREFPSFACVVLSVDDALAAMGVVTA